jgi:hypothetical protein
MRIVSNGNVLINTTTDAGFRLDVNGTARVSGATTITLNANSTTSLLNITNLNAGTSSRAILTTQSSTALGQFGTVSSTWNATSDILPNETYVYGQNGVLINTLSSQLIRFNIGTERMRISSTGNLLIGTTTDSGYKLDVNGDTKTLGLLTAYGISTNLSDMAIYNTTNNTGYIRFITQTASAQAERMRIFNTGNVGINTTTDAGYKLDVNGTARVVNQLTVQGMTIGLGGGAVVSNTVVGNVAFNSNTSGQNNTAIGESALFSNTTGTANVAVGRRALFASNSAQNVALGNDSLRFNTAANNTAVGYFSLYNNTTGASNTSIGHNSGNTTTTGSGNVFIGKDAVALNATDSNQFVVGSSTTNAGSVTTEINTSTQVWNVVINGVARKILLA